MILQCNVNLIHVVNVPQMYGMYLLRKEEMQLTRMGNSDKERILFHVTTKSRAVESLKNGLDWRRTRRSKFGCGVSFSDNADYANYYADKLPKEGIIIYMASLIIYVVCLEAKFSPSPIIKKASTFKATQKSLSKHTNAIARKWFYPHFLPL